MSRIGDIVIYVRLILIFILEGICLHFATIFGNVRLMYDMQFGDFDPYLIFAGLIIVWLGLFLNWVNDMIEKYKN